MANDRSSKPPLSVSRRAFILTGTAVTGNVLVACAPGAGVTPTAPGMHGSSTVDLSITVNRRSYTTQVDARTTLLDLLREHFGLTGTKKGCNRGECGACTVHLDDDRVNACMLLAAACDGRAVTTIEGLSDGGQLHPVQRAFIDEDGFQCGFCTPGQVMSAVACIREGHATSDASTREWMSGNLCRCSAYPQIVRAVRSAAGKRG